jgi:serine/threonine protein kinase
MADSDTLVGHTVGRFVIEDIVGEEALGKVYFAKEQPSGRSVTVKVLNPHRSNDFEASGRFQREMVASATLAEHPNTVQMLDFGEYRGIFHYIVLETIDARSLADELVAKKKLPPERVGAIAFQIASALGAAHPNGIVHRNLRPENVLLLNNAKGDFVKVRDFGMARVDDGSGPQLTTAGERVGTVAYMAPEYIEAAEVTSKADLYALGCLMFEMAVGHPPYQGKKADVMELHVEGEIPPVEGAPAWLAALVTDLLAKDPAARPASALDVMKRIEAGLGKRVVLPAVTSLAPEQVGAVRRKRTEAAEAPSTSSSVAKIAVGVGVLVLGISLVGLIVVGLVVALGLSM